jgi:signal transduction histidine kinase
MPTDTRIQTVTFRQHWWLVVSAVLVLAFAAVSLTAPRGVGLYAFGDLAALLLVSLATGVIVANAMRNHGQTRIFWVLMATGCFLWTINQSLWTVYEAFLRRELPDPFVGDIVLFSHVVPFMAAVALRPHRPQEEQKLYFTTLNFLMLLIWWMFLYAFIVFPDEYIATNVPIYSRNFDLLYLLENLVLLSALGALAITTKGAWKKIYLGLFGANALYAFSSETMNMAIARGQYFSGSLYDVTFIASLCGLIWVGLLALQLKPACEPATQSSNRWLILAPRLAMVAILSLPLLGFYAMFIDHAPNRLRYFRVLVTLAAMLVLGACVFIRQFLLDRQLVRLLESSNQSLENLQRLQSQLVQKEKLASLGQLVAGAAHEINNPLAAILGYSELLSTTGSLSSDQITMARKIGFQARRTRDLVSGLLSFAQQSPGEKTLVDVGALLQRAMQMEILNLETRKIRGETQITPDLAKIWGNSSQLLQCCLQIIGNAMDALEEVGGGVLTASARREGEEILLEFADSGPGIREPRRVFDPFYTTKPIGKGTGLGLSATYGMVQDHHGQISCHNRAEGGAVFILRFPVAREQAPLGAQAARA